MKIAQVVCVFPPYKGGMGTVARQFKNLSDENNNQVTVFTPDYGNGKQKTEDEGVVRLRPFLKYGNAAFLPQLLFRLRNFDIVHLHYPFFGTAEVVWFAKRVLRMKFSLIVHYHMDVSGLPFFAGLFSLPSKSILRSLIKEAEAVTCASFDYMKESRAKDIFIEFAEKFYEIPFGVDSEKFSPKKIRPAGAMASRDELKILFVGGLDKAHFFKGVDVLLESVSGLRRADWILRIVGKGELITKYRQLAERLKIEQKVEFLDNVSNNDLPRIYRESDILVLPSINRNEAFGIVLLEAMSSGLAVIASDLPGVRTVFKEKIQGYLVEPGNHSDLREKIGYFFDRGKIAEMGEKARSLVLGEYSLNIVSQKINNLYKKIYES